MGKIITIASHKGGVGKTTTSLNLGFSLSRLGQKVLVVDADPQGGLAVASNLKKRTTNGLINLLKNNLTPAQVIIPTKDRTMGFLGTGIVEVEDVFFFEREARKGSLGKIIQQASEDYNYTIIDAPAGFGSTVTALLSVSNSVLIPINCRAITVKTLPAFLKLIQRLRNKINTGLLIEGILVNMIQDDPSAIEIYEEIQKTFPPSVLFETMIEYNDSIEAASMKAIPVAMLNGGETAAQDYLNLAVELKNRELSASKKGSDEDEGLF